MFDGTEGTALPYLLDPATDALTPSPLGVASEIFCSGHTFLVDGRVRVVGGNEADDQNIRTHLFDPSTAKPASASKRAGSADSSRGSAKWGR